jgi:hypothetical protein
MKDLSNLVAQLQSELERGLDKERHEREKFVLQVENAALRVEHLLHSSESKKHK